MSERRPTSGSSPRSLWLWAGTVFLVHTAVVLILTKLHFLAPSGSTASQLSRSVLKLLDPWVFWWVDPLLNTPAMATPVTWASMKFGVSTPESVGEFFEFFPDAVFGGLAYVVIVVGAVGLRRRLHRRHGQHPADAKRLSADGLPGRIFSIFSAVLAAAVLSAVLVDWSEGHQDGHAEVIALGFTLLYVLTTVSLLRRSGPRFWLAAAAGFGLFLLASNLLLRPGVGEGAILAICLPVALGLMGGLGMWIGLDGLDRGDVA